MSAITQDVNGHENHSTSTPPDLDAIRAAVKAAIVEAALAGAIDATRVHTAIKLLSLEDA
ncbi:MAG TPA: hypothetical protein VKB53_11225 [Gammaproteobacteria bacterium]|nr:hypothetical protein [Gammaproteobacteria bacterium]